MRQQLHLKRSRVLMPTQSLLDHMRKKYNLQDFMQDNINKLDNRLGSLRAM